MIRPHARAIRLFGERLGELWSDRGGCLAASQRRQHCLESRLVCNLHHGQFPLPSCVCDIIMTMSPIAGGSALHTICDLDRTTYVDWSVLQANVGGLLTFTAALRALPAVTAVAASLCGNMLLSVRQPRHLSRPTACARLSHGGIRAAAPSCL